MEEAEMIEVSAALGVLVLVVKHERPPGGS